MNENISPTVAASEYVNLILDIERHRADGDDYAMSTAFEVGRFIGCSGIEPVYFDADEYRIALTANFAEYLLIKYRFPSIETVDDYCRRLEAEAEERNRQIEAHTSSLRTEWEKLILGSNVTGLAQTTATHLVVQPSNDWRDEVCPAGRRAAHTTMTDSGTFRIIEDERPHTLDVLRSTIGGGSER